MRKIFNKNNKLEKFTQIQDVVFAKKALWSSARWLILTIFQVLEMLRYLLTKTTTIACEIRLGFRWKICSRLVDITKIPLYAKGDSEGSETSVAGYSSIRFSGERDSPADITRMAGLPLTGHLFSQIPHPTQRFRSTKGSLTFTFFPSAPAILSSLR